MGVERASLTGMPWYYEPQSGGQKIPAHLHDTLCRQAEDFSRGRSWYGRTRLVLRFSGRFCYVEEQRGDDKRVSPFIRLRYFRSPMRDGAIWSMAVYACSHERFEP